MSDDTTPAGTTLGLARPGAADRRRTTPPRARMASDIRAYGCEQRRADRHGRECTCHICPYRAANP